MGKRRKGRNNEPKKKGGGGGLLAGAGIGSGAGLFGLGGLLGGLNSSNDDFGGRGTSGFASSSSMASGDGGSNYTPAGAATSVLSDADSSDPVVRQLQDIEKVLVSIKGDTAILAGVGGRGGLFGRGKNNPALQAMYGRPERSDGDMRSFLPLLAAMLYGFFSNAQDQDGGDTFVDKNNDGINDRDQDPNLVATETALDPAVEEAALKSTRMISAAGTTADILKPIVVGATKVATGIVDAGVSAASAASDIFKSGSTMADSLPDSAIDTNTARSGPNPNVRAANDAINPDVRVPDIDPDAPDSLKSKVFRSLAKSIGKFTPIAGDAITIADMGAKIEEGDFTGAWGEAVSLGLTYGSKALAIPASVVGTPLAGAGVIAAGTAAAAVQDYHNATRDLYKEYYNKKPEDDPPELREQRYNELYGYVVEYLKNLPADLMQRGPVEAELQVEARPEVTTPVGRGRMQNAQRIQEQRAQAEWDDKYGEMYNPDGSMKPEFVPAAKAEAAAQGTGFIDRALTRYEGEIETAKQLGEQIKEGASRLAPGLKITSDTVELSTETAERVDREEQARQFSNGVGESVAMNQKIQSTGVIPNMPEVNVSVSSPKTSHPTGMHEISWIGDRIQMLT